MKSEKGSMADLGKADKGAFITVGLGENTGKHFHVDITKQEIFPKKLMPKSTRNISLAKVEKQFERLDGKEILVDYKGLFVIGLAELPEAGIIKSLSFQTQFGDVAIKLRAANLSVKGAPVNSISWNMRADGKEFRVMLTAEKVVARVGENYLTDALSMLENAFKVFILGKISNERK
jgi:hypothetical protein